MDRAAFEQGFAQHPWKQSVGKRRRDATLRGLQYQVSARAFGGVAFAIVQDDVPGIRMRGQRCIVMRPLCGFMQQQAPIERKGFFCERHRKSSAGVDWCGRPQP